MMMMKTNLEQIKEEFCTRYGLKPEQIDFDIRILNVEKKIAKQIGKDYGRPYEYRNGKDYFVGKDITIVHNADFQLYAHYPHKEGDELVIELES